ncbi:ATP synthase F0 subunit B [Roseiconus nitratireducens]|uniref:ATP synthase F0 subunit B n=1 Tax=Roseiconus nitratireducens TaxID=2605748 RepID=A0A5M6DJ53_9BACT|nr:ATP synthase F0 subunit B [Roseiconus nitratireducens]KAA5546239.1 ATP synthase F0 subunit B [Roseiconus nitratireducens]
MSPILTTFLFEAANFLVLAAALGWFFFRPVRNAIAEYRSKIETDQRAAETKLEEARKRHDQVDQAYARLHEDIAREREKQLEAAREQAGKILDEARQVADRELKLSHHQAAQITNSQRDRLAEVAATAAAASVGRLLEELSGERLHDALVESACRQLRQWQDGLAPVSVEHSLPLSETQVEALKEAAGKAAETAEFHTVDGLGAGVRVLTAQGLVDASTAGISTFARRSLVKEMQDRANNPAVLQDVSDA